MFNLILTNGKEDTSIPFKVRNTSIAKKWYKELLKNYKLYEIDRFTNWGNHNLINELNHCIDEINKSGVYIDRYISTNSTSMQQDLNYLHKFFEDLRGEATIGTEWFNNSPKKIQKCVERFNILIHQLEAELRTTNHPTVVVTFKDRPVIDLTQEDMKHFTFQWTHGTVYINYCQVGKTVLDIFKDKDSVAKGIRPQEFYSADFMVKFGPAIPYPMYLLRKIYINLWVKLQSFKFKNLNLGMIPVADLIQDIDTTHLKKYNEVKGVQCIK
tara:strand:+ start:197 stop:1006 length:810 start_codon:yes stop_codon:yes gene_type:complete